jgi:DNA-binding LacI/PurR family transcriptional regulator
MKRAPTLNDVAELAKVSRSLASLVFQDSPKVSEQSRKAVIKAAEKLGYQPNESARRLKSAHTKSIGVVLTDIHNPYYAYLFYGVESASSDSEYKILIGNSGFLSDELNQRPQILKSRQIESIKNIRSQMIDGLICSSLRTTSEELRAASRNLPLVIIGHTPSSLIKDFDVVATDEAYAAYLVVDHLTSLGHKKIAHISGGTDDGPALRSKSFMAEMRKRKLSTSARILEGHWSQEAGYDCTEELLKSKDRPTAIYAANDLIAMGVLAKLKEKGIRVPVEISVVGYDDSQFAQLHLTDLTSVKESLFEMGRLGFELLTTRLEGKRGTTSPQLLRIKPDLVVRSSTGPVSMKSS